MSFRGDSKTPASLLLNERLSGPSSKQDSGSVKKPTETSNEGPRPGLRSLTLFGSVEKGTPATERPKTTDLLSRDLLSRGPRASSQSGVERLLSHEKAALPALPAQAAPHLSFFAPTLEALACKIRENLESSPSLFLQLNRTRREAIARYLELRAGSSLPGAGLAQQSQDVLRRWFDPTLRSQDPTSPHARAVTRYLDEIALINLAEAIVLKAWSDRGTRKWKRDDLQDLNSTLHVALRSHVPVEREGWQFTRPNFYSWFKLPSEVQDSIWREFGAWRIVDEGPELLVGLIRGLLRALHSDTSAHYDEGVYRALWHSSGNLGTQSELASKRRKWAFSPTLRDGTVVRTGDTEFGWYGFESDAFSLFLSELSLLWWGPSTPPYWSVGHGLDAMSGDQLSLNLATSAKRTVQQQIAEMEACDLAWVTEEHVLRGASRTPSASQYREAVEQIPALKRIRSGATSLGHLQACVAMSKLRPGGKLWWLREEGLHASDGAEALQFLLDRGRLIAEWDLSAIQLTFSAQPGTSPLPRALSLWVRDSDVKRRHSHQPLRIKVKGQLRSHVELAPLLEDLLRMVEAEGTGDPSPVQKSGWQILVQRSPQPQSDWADHWPEATEEQDLQQLEAIRLASQPLANLGMIRPLDGATAQERSSLVLQGALKGFKVSQKLVDGKRRLSCSSLQWGTHTGTENGTFAVLLGDESIAAPLKAYLESDLASFWLDQKVEVRARRWQLREQDLKILPVPMAIGSRQVGFATPLPGSWEKLSGDLAIRPSHVRESLKTLDADATSTRIRTELFVRTSRILDDLRASQARLRDYVTEDGRIIWRSLLQKCDASEFCPITLHPEISAHSMHGSFPLQTPITQVVRSSRGSWTLRLTTESGIQIQLDHGHRQLFEMVAEQVEALSHPTWSEIIEFVRAPRRIDLVEQRACEILRASGEQQHLIRELELILIETLPSLIREGFQH